MEQSKKLELELKPLSKANDTNYEWTDKEEDLLRRYSEQARCYQHINEYSAKKYTVRYNILTGVTLFLNLLTAISGVQNQYDDIDIRNAIGFFSTIIGGLLTVIQLINTRCSVSENKARYEQLGKRWESFMNLIELELTKNRTERTKKSILLPKCAQDFENIGKDHVGFATGFKEDFNKTYDGIDICKPPILDGFSKLEINRTIIEIDNEKENQLEQIIIENFKLQHGRPPSKEEFNDILLLDPLYSEYMKKNEIKKDVISEESLGYKTSVVKDVVINVGDDSIEEVKDDKINL